jgi:hypothetical protein
MLLAPASFIVILCSSASDTRPLCLVSALQPLQPQSTSRDRQSVVGDRDFFWALIGASALEIFGFASGVRPINFQFHRS